MTGNFELSTLTPAFLKVARESAIRVAFADGRDIYDSVAFRLRLDGRAVAEAAVEGRPGTDRHEVRLAVTPLQPGPAQLSLEVVCATGGAYETYAAPVGLFADGLDETRPDSEYDCDFVSAWTPRAAELVHSPDRLSLVGEKEVIQLVSPVMVRFGRGKGDENDVCLRVIGPEGLMEVGSSASISRQHFRLANEGGQCVVYDGSAEGQRSSFGTRVNGRDCAREVLAPGAEYRVSVGRPELKLVMKARVFGGAFGGASGVLIRRRDAAAERIAVVWRELSFADGGKLEWDGRTWTLRAAGGATRRLAVGDEVAVEGAAYRVRPFDQEEFIHPTGRYCRAGAEEKGQ